MFQAGSYTAQRTMATTVSTAEATAMTPAATCVAGVVVRPAKTGSRSRSSMVMVIPAPVPVGARMLGAAPGSQTDRHDEEPEHTDEGRHVLQRRQRDADHQ